MLSCFHRLGAWGAGAVAGLLFAGCSSLISPDVTDFDLTLPDKKFTIDAGSWNVGASAADDFVTMRCAETPMLCEHAVQQACPIGCSGACGAAGLCDLSLDINLKQPVNLVMEKPELKSINDEPVIKVTIDSVTYEVTKNSLNVDTPDISVSVAPGSVVAQSETTPIGTIAAVPAGQTTTAPRPLAFSTTGKAELVKIMSSFKTPFNVFIGAKIVVSAGQPVPSGLLEAVVHIKGHAGL
jgi:hypothetical protein